MSGISDNWRQVFMTAIHSSHLARQMGHTRRINYPIHRSERDEDGKLLCTANAFACRGITTDELVPGLAARVTEQGNPATVHNESAGPNRRKARRNGARPDGGRGTRIERLI